MDSDGKNPTGSLLSCQRLLGCKVENPRGEGLGRIEDIMISAEGQVAYAVVSFGGVLSLWNKLFAFPWSALRVDDSKKRVILNLDRQTLSRTRGFEKGQGPDSSDLDWGTRVPSPSPSAPVEPERAAVSATRTEPPRQDTPSPNGSPELEPAASSKNRIEYWGEVWQSHGLDR